MSENSAYSKFKIEGLDEIRSVIKTLPTELQQKVMAVAVKRAAAPLVNAAKLFAGRSERTGALRKSIGALVKKGRDGSAYAVIGAIRGQYRNGKKLGKGESRKGADDPANYAHLVEFGHVAVSPKQGKSLRKRTARPVGFVSAKPFLRPALMSSGDAVATEMANGIADGIERIRRRIVKNPAYRG